MFQRSSLASLDDRADAKIRGLHLNDVEIVWYLVFGIFMNQLILKESMLEVRQLELEGNETTFVERHGRIGDSAVSSKVVRIVGWRAWPAR